MNYYYTISIARNDLDERPITRRAAVIKVNNHYNLLPILNGIEGLVCVHQAGTRKHAIEIAEAWNEAYLNNGEYALSTTKTYPVYPTECY